jgi:glutamate racemase
LSDQSVTSSTNHADSQAAVGVFDSGVGGLSVLQHIRSFLPAEPLLYFADSGFAPYGEKTDEIIIERSLKITEFLLQQNIKALVIACNTATAAAAATLRQRYPDLTIIGIEPGLKPAALQSKTKVVGVLATQSTLLSPKFNHLRDHLSQETGVQFHLQACNGLVDQIEKGELQSTETLRLVQRYVAPLLRLGADTLVLGCTHYPFVAHLILQVIKQTAGVEHNVELIDTGEAVARQVQRQLQQHELLSVDDTTKSMPLVCWTTGCASALEHALTNLLKLSVDQYSVSAIVSDNTPY